MGVPAALQALAHRERALLTVTTLEHDLAKARGSLEGTQVRGLIDFVFDFEPWRDLALTRVRM